MQRVMFRNFYLLIALCSGFCCNTANAGEITREAPGSNFNWQSTDCVKPIQYTSPTQSKQESLQLYSEDITAYLACLQKEAQRDFEKAQLAMQTAIETELEAETKRMDENIKRAYRTTR